MTSPPSSSSHLPRPAHHPPKRSSNLSHLVSGDEDGIRSLDNEDSRHTRHDSPDDSREEVTAVASTSQDDFFGRPPQPHHHHHHHHHRRRHPYDRHRSISPPSQPHHRHHPFPHAASSSVADLSLLADLVDHRSGWGEDKRMSDEAIAAQCKGKSRAVKRGLQEYYSEMNYILDGWRTADIIIESQFPAEVMRRFGTVEEVQQALGKSKALDQWSRSTDLRRVAVGSGSNRTGSHTQLRHLLATSSAPGTPDGYHSPGLGMTSSDDEDDRRHRGRQRYDHRYHRHHADGHGDEERGYDDHDERGAGNESFGTRAAQAFGLGSLWFRSGGGRRTSHSGEDHVSKPSPSPEASYKKRSSNALKSGQPYSDQPYQSSRQMPPSKQPRAKSDEESGFDSDSEPEPEGAGPKVRQAQEERKSLLRDGAGERGRTKLKNQNYGSTADQTNSTNNGGNARVAGGTIVVRAFTPSGRQPISVENLEPDSQEGSLDRQLKSQKEQQHAVTERKAQQVAGLTGSEDVAVSTPPGNDEDDERRDQLADLPGGKRERDRLLLRQAVPGWEEREEREERSVQFAINLNLLINVLLLAGKAVAVLSSSSVSLLASLVDSALDLLSTIIIFAASKAATFKSESSYFRFPKGKAAFEPLGVVIFSVLMIASFVQVLVESLSRLSVVVRTGQDPESGSSAELPLIGIAFMVATIGVKAVMWLLYRSSRNSGVRAVAQDSQNDVVFNIFSLTFPFLGSWLQWPALDPIGGVVLSVYIITEWLETLVETTTRLSGSRASPSELARILYLIYRFKSVQFIAGCEVYHSGDDLTVEMDIVLPVGTALKRAHDLAEVCTYCVESMPSVERAFMHLDYWAHGISTHLKGPI
ncbi:unnamed protein product [Jaminaea pallidilutea]